MSDTKPHSSTKRPPYVPHTADPMLGIDNRNATPPAAVGAPQTAPKANPPNCPSTPVDAVPSTAEYPFWFGTATSAYQVG